jgi:hypothetical protein
LLEGWDENGETVGEVWEERGGEGVEFVEHEEGIEDSDEVIGVVYGFAVNGLDLAVVPLLVLKFKEKPVGGGEAHLDCPRDFPAN